MRKFHGGPPWRWFRTISAAATIALAGGVGCSTGSPTNSTSLGTPATLAGTWSGTTFQSRSISFAVSSANRVTDLSLGYQIDACAGIASFANLDIAVFDVSGTGGSAFAFGQTVSDRPDVGVGVQGFWMPDGSVRGTLIVYGKPSCGTSEAVAGPFQATRR